jgi:hypothetical protein
MGQKSNLLTLRKNKTKELNLQSQEPKLFLKGYTFLNKFERLLNKKNILMDEKELNFEANKIFLNISIFFRSNKTLFYRRKGLVQKSKNFSNLTLKPLFFNNFRNLSNNILSIKLTNLNNYLDRDLLNSFYGNFKRFVGVLFNRRFNLFIDFLKINCLFLKSRISSRSYLSLLGQIFRILPKSKHGRFLLFLKILFKSLIDISKNSRDKNVIQIVGIKLLISGRLKGKPRSSRSCIQVGSVPSQSLEKNVDFSKVHVYTLYGAFGFKIWVHKKLK